MATFNAIDIRSARKRGVRPLPLRSDGEAGVDLQAIESGLTPQSGTTIESVALADRAEAWSREHANEETVDQSASARVSRWQKRLLDLSLRNRLLNFKETGRTLPLSVPNLAELEDMLADSWFRSTSRGSTSTFVVAKEATADMLLSWCLRPFPEKSFVRSCRYQRTI